VARFSIEVTERKVKAGREAKLPTAAGPSDFTNSPGGEMAGSKLLKADRNPKLDRVQELSPLSDS
jgi:hypothetical protein